MESVRYTPNIGDQVWFITSKQTEPLLGGCTIRTGYIIHKNGPTFHQYLDGEFYWGIRYWDSCMDIALVVRRVSSIHHHYTVLLPKPISYRCFVGEPRPHSLSSGPWKVTWNSRILSFMSSTSKSDIRLATVIIPGEPQIKHHRRCTTSTSFTHSLWTSVSTRRLEELCCWGIEIQTQIHTRVTNRGQKDRGWRIEDIGQKSTRRVGISISEKRLDNEIAYHNRSGLSLRNLERFASCTREWWKPRMTVIRPLSAYDSGAAYRIQSIILQSLNIS